MQKYFDAVLSSDGSPVTGVNVTVKLNGTNTLASLFSDAAGTVPLANPVVTDNRGIFQFYAADGRYDLTFAATGFSPYTFTDIAIDEQDSAGTIAFTPAGGISANTVAGALTELDSDKENVGVAASGMAAHLAASNPHSQYLTPAEGDAAYSALGHTHAAYAELSGALFTGAVGYGAGGGGSVTQETSKGTAVVINKPSGKITTHNGSLGPGQIAVFEVTNSNVTDNDVVALSFNGNWIAAYSLTTTVYNGAFYIGLRNETGGSLSDAVVINFAVIKAAVS
jgi:hypothetical protein